MSTTLPARTGATPVRARGLLHSEWIKARSSRPLMWAAAATVILAAGLAAVVPLVAATAPQGEEPAETITTYFSDRPAVQILFLGYSLVQALVVIIGVLLVSGERSSGLRNVTLAAVPRRTPVFVAKLVLSGGIGLTIGLLMSLTMQLIVQPTLIPLGLDDSLWTGIGLQVVLGGSLSLALLSIVATALSSLFPNTASAVGFVLSLMLLVPIVTGLIPGVGQTVTKALPSSAADMLSQPADVTGWGPVFTGIAILLAWAAVSSVVAGVAWKRRDV